MTAEIFTKLYHNKILDDKKLLTLSQQALSGFQHSGAPVHKAHSITEMFSQSVEVELDRTVQSPELISAQHTRDEVECRLCASSYQPESLPDLTTACGAELEQKKNCSQVYKKLQKSFQVEQRQNINDLWFQCKMEPCEARTV